MTLITSLSVRSRQLFHAWFSSMAVFSGGNPDRNGLPLQTERLREHHHTGSLHQKI
ncbi:MAG: hypothetical protein V7K71_15530 [Nostoc sp.]|uniref:hypothetical protein n=1 Tax=Nostoc sp. TaxID=1180 RepID=UPI002FF6E6AE